MPVMMGADTNKKKVASLILARLNPSGETKDTGEVGPDSASPHSEGERAAGEEMIAAFHSKDVDGLISAFKSLLDILDGPGDEPEEEYEPGSSFVG